MSLSNFNLIGLRCNVMTVLIVSARSPLQISIHSGPLKLWFLCVRTDLCMPSTDATRDEVVQHQRASINILGIAPFLHLIAEYVFELDGVVDRPTGRINDAVVITLVDFIV